MKLYREFLSLFLFIAIVYCTSLSTGANCGNGICDSTTENCRICSLDCGVCPPCERSCGNGMCEQLLNETSCNCPQDCGVCCINGFCNTEGGETFANCPGDCSTTIRGRVVHCDFPDVYLTATVQCETKVPTVSMNTSTSSLPNQTGWFEFKNVEPNDWTCTASSVGYITNRAGIKLEVGSGEQQRTFYVKLCPKRGSLSGTVIINAGEPVDGAKVVCTTDGPKTVARTLKYTTSPAGLFYFTGVTPNTPGETYTCQAFKEGFNPGTTAAIVQADANTNINIIIERLPGTLIGTVLDGQTFLPVTEPINVNCTPVDPTIIFRGTNPASTGSTAGFRYLGLGAGIYQCVGFQQGWITNSTKISVPIGSVGTGVILLSKEKGVINGTVAETTGLLLSGIRIRCNDVKGNLVADGTSTNGVFRFPGLDNGVYTCTGSDVTRYQNSVPVTTKVTPATTSSINITMVPLQGQIVGLVRETALFGGAAIDGAWVNCTDRNTNLPSVLSVPITPLQSENFLVANVTPGNVSCSCSKVGYNTVATSNASGVLVSNGKISFTCELVPILGAINVTVLENVTKAPLVNTLLIVTCIGRGGAYSSAVSGFGPSFIFNSTTELRGGIYNCRVTNVLGYQDSPVTPPIYVGANVSSVTIYIHPQVSTITGYVEDSLTKAKVPNATITCTLRPQSETTSALGVYTFNDLLHTGPYNCTASANGFLSATQVPPAMSRGTNQVLNFVLTPVTTSLNITLYDNLERNVQIGGQVSCTSQWGSATIPSNSYAPPQNFIFMNSRLGNWTCTGKSINYTDASSSFIISSSAPVSGSIYLPPLPSAVYGQVKDQRTGLLIVNATVSCGFTTQTQMTPLNGSYSFENVFTLSPFNCTANKIGYPPINVGPFTVARGVRLNIDLLVPPLEGGIRVTVIDSQNSSAINASVLCSGGPLGFSKTIPEIGTARPPFVFSNLLTGGYTCTAANSLEYFSNVSNVAVQAPNEATATITLYPKPATLRGKIRDAIAVNNPGLPGANVSCTFTASTGASSTVATNPVRVTADANGDFAIANILDFNVVTCQAVTTGFRPNSGSVSIQRGQQHFITIDLTPQDSLLQGYAFDQELSTPLSNVTIQFWLSTNPNPITTTVTDTAGKFSVVSPRGTYVSSKASKVGWAVISPFNCAPVQCQFGGSFLLIEGTTQNVNFTLPPLPSSLAAQVRQNVAPFDVISNATVNVTKDGVFYQTKQTDIRGNVVFDNIRGGSVYVISAVGFNYVANTTGQINLARGQNLVLPILLTPKNTTIFGYTFERSTQRAISGMKVTLLDDVTGQRLSNVPGDLFTDANGRYSFVTSLPTPRIRVSFTCEGGSCTKYYTSSTKVIQPMNEDVLLSMCCSPPPAVNVFSQDVAATQIVRGFLNWAHNGTAAIGFGVEVRRLIGGQLLAKPTETDNFGYYSVEIEVSTPFDVRVPANLFFSTSEAVSPNNGSNYAGLAEGTATAYINFTLSTPKTGNIGGTIVNTTGSPISAATVTARTCTSSSFAEPCSTYSPAVTLSTSNIGASNGGYTLTGLTIGHYVICVNSTGYIDNCMQVLIGSLQTTTVSFTMSPTYVDFNIQFRLCSPTTGCVNATTGSGPQRVAGIVTQYGIREQLPTNTLVSGLTSIINVKRTPGTYYVWCASGVSGYKPYTGYSLWQSNPASTDPSVTAYWVRGLANPITHTSATPVTLFCDLIQCASGDTSCGTK